MSEEKKPRIQDLPEKPASPELSEAVKGGFGPSTGPIVTRWADGSLDDQPKPTPTKLL